MLVCQDGCRVAKELKMQLLVSIWLGCCCRLCKEPCAHRWRRAFFLADHMAHGLCHVNLHCMIYNEADAVMLSMTKAIISPHFQDCFSFAGGSPAGSSQGRENLWVVAWVTNNVTLTLVPANLAGVCDAPARKHMLQPRMLDARHSPYVL